MMNKTMLLSLLSILVVVVVVAKADEGSSGATVCQQLSGLNDTTATSSVLPLPETEDGIQFNSWDVWCSYHCHPVWQINQLHDDCTSHCECSSPRRNLQEEEKLVFLQCEDEDQTSMVLTESSISLGSFFNTFQNAYNAVIDDLTTNDQDAICQFAQLTSGDVEASANTDDTDVPSLVHVSTNSADDCSISQVTALDQSNTAARISSSSTSEIWFMNLNTAQALAVSELSCVKSVKLMSPVLKLAPLARSIKHINGTDFDVVTIPSLLVRVDGTATSVVLPELESELLSSLGLSSMLTTLTTDDGYLVLEPMTSADAWVSALTIIVNHKAIEWVDVLPVTVSLLHSRSFRKTDKKRRRLDAFIGDVLATDDANAIGLTGGSIVVGVTDTGLYIDHDQFDQNDRNIYDNINLDARKVVLYETFGDALDQSETITCGHGTHVSGIVAGSSNSGSSRDFGIAPEAKLAFKDIGTQSASCAGNAGCAVPLLTPLSADDLFMNQVQAGARIFSFSWGTLESDYSAQAQDIDRYLNENKDVIVVVAAGNSGSVGSQTISSPAGAKNVITVGASMNSEASFGSSCSEVNNPNTVASFSSIGPTSDGRLKPDLVAPGQSISSAESLAPGSTESTSGECSLQGTSQSTPAVAGVVTLMYQWLSEGWWKTGSADPTYAMAQIPASLIKALLIHSSEGLERRVTSVSSSCSILQSSTFPLSYPDNNQGYGRPLFTNFATLDTIDFTEKVYFLPNNTAAAPSVSQGAIHQYNYTVRRAETLRVTIVWTDPAGSLSSSRMLQNDIDLSVTVAGASAEDKIYYPLSGNGDFDRLNNVEMVQVDFDTLLADLPNGGLLDSENENSTATIDEIVVTATVAGFTITGDQEYSLVASSGSIGSTQSAGVGGDGSGFWQPWMTFLAIGLVSAVLVVALFSTIQSKRQRHRAAGNYAGGPSVFLPPPARASQRLTSRQSSSTPVLFNPQGQPYIMVDGSGRPIDATTGLPIVQDTAAAGDKCPYCRFRTPDPVVLVDHVVNMHAGVSNSYVPPPAPLPPPVQVELPPVRQTAVNTALPRQSYGAAAPLPPPVQVELPPVRNTAVNMALPTEASVTPTSATPPRRRSSACAEQLSMHNASTSLYPAPIPANADVPGIRNSAVAMPLPRTTIVDRSSNASASSDNFYPMAVPLPVRAPAPLPPGMQAAPNPPTVTEAPPATRPSAIQAPLPSDNDSNGPVYFEV